MPVIKLYLHGLTAGIPPGENTHARALRGQVQGWTNSSTRSNTRFLYSVEPDGLTGYGYALTLTLRDCPPTAAEFHQLRRRYIDRLRYNGMIRMHWLIEWQRRGVPHLHAAVWFAERPGAGFLTKHWVAVASEYGALPWGQHVEPIHDAVGWFKYLSKHASRGLSHYQRSPQGIPEGWKGTTGRMWGRLGKWQVREAMDVSLNLEGFHRLRRVVRGWRRGDARRAMKRAQPTPGDQAAYPAAYWGAVRRLVAARRMLKSSSREASTVRGLSEWMPMNDQLRVLSWLSAQGYQMRS